MYSKCATRIKPAYITDLENQLSNAVDGLANETTKKDETASKDSKAKSGATD